MLIFLGFLVQKFERYSIYFIYIMQTNKMNFFGNFLRPSAPAPAPAPAVPASLPPGWQQIIVDGNTMYLNLTTNEISSTPPSSQISSSPALPRGWVEKNENGKIYYAGPLLEEGITYRQDEFPTWKYRPEAIRLSPKWTVFFSNESTRKIDDPKIIIYKNKETNETTKNYPLADGEDLKKILATESAKSAAQSSSWGDRMRDSGYRGGLKNKSKRKQRKRKQSKRKWSY
jgi:hypothetical protein